MRKLGEKKVGVGAKSQRRETLHKRKKTEYGLDNIGDA